MNRNAARQRAFRQRHLQAIEGTKAQLNVIVSLPAKLALKRLCQHDSVTQGGLLDRLLADEQRQVLSAMSAEGQNRSFDAVTQ
jgi:hypothetical protein